MLASDSRLEEAMREASKTHWLSIRLAIAAAILITASILCGIYLASHHASAFLLQLDTVPFTLGLALLVVQGRIGIRQPTRKAIQAGLIALLLIQAVLSLLSLLLNAPVHHG
jgi:hypothetical protein